MRREDSVRHEDFEQNLRIFETLMFHLFVYFVRLSPLVSHKFTPLPFMWLF